MFLSSLVSLAALTAAASGAHTNSTTNSTATANSTVTTFSAGSSSSLADLCTTANIQSALPSNGTLLGIDLLPSTVNATAVYNSTLSSSTGGTTSSSSASDDDTPTYSYCNVSVSYTHTGKNDIVSLIYAFPQPSDFQNRFYVGGGGGYSLSTVNTGGLAYGAASGATDAGYDSFITNYDKAALYGNGTVNWDAAHMFGYQALGELTLVGKAITRSLYNLSDSSSSSSSSNANSSSSKLYTYFEGCSDGGREGMSQVQRYGEEYDGVITGAPAFRYAQQQVNHVFSSVVEHTLDHYPAPCAMDKIVNATIEACDPLDGRTDGVVARTDLCMLQFNLSSLVGQEYACAEQESTSLGFGFSGGAGGAEGSTSSYVPAQNGTVSEQDIAVAQTIYGGLHNSAGQRAYLSWQIASSFEDATTTYDNDTASWQLSIPSTGGEFVTKFVQLLDLDNLSDLNNVTYDTLIEWMNIALIRYMSTLQTTWPDLTTFQSSGGKLLHYHGESDNSIPTASSVRYWQSVRNAMYANASDDDAQKALADWYQLYLVPGAGHCGANALQPGPYPEDNMATLIDWVENSVVPTYLNATVSSGAYANETQQLCQWPTRPLWSSNASSTFDCVTDQASLDSWTYTFDAFDVEVY